MMIQINLNDPSFTYDVHSLVRAFYPGAEVSVKERHDLQAAEGSVKERHDLQAAEGSVKERHDLQAAEPVSLRIDIVFRESGGICFSFYQPDSKDTSPVLTGEADDTGTDRADVKNALKQTLYDLLCAYTHRSLPWGSLTGIRPVKIPMKMLREGASDAQIHAYMKERYRISDAKSALALGIAKKEREILQRAADPGGYSLYVGIPFCPTTCAYCSFTSFSLSKWKDQVDVYLDALQREIDYAAEAFSGRPLVSLYIGGGTPTTLTPVQAERLYSLLEDRFDLSNLREWTVEAGRPDSITPEKLAVMRTHGITRISINPQTMKEETLRLIGRHHTVQQTVEAFHMARDAGFSNINMDLILGLPQETADDVRRTMEQVCALGPDSITVHTLAIKRAARLHMQPEEFASYFMTNSEESMETMRQYAADIGLTPYYLYRQKNMVGNLENVGYARAGCEGLYNILIMEEIHDIPALGAGAVSKRVLAGDRPGTQRIERCANVKDIASYLERIDEMIDRKRALYCLRCNS